MINFFYKIKKAVEYLISNKYLLVDYKALEKAKEDFDRKEHKERLLAVIGNFAAFEVNTSLVYTKLSNGLWNVYYSVEHRKTDDEINWDNATACWRVVDAVDAAENKVLSLGSDYMTALARNHMTLFDLVAK